MRIATTILPLCIVTCFLSMAADNPLAPATPNVPSHWMTDASFPTSNTEHLRMDEAEISKIGDGSFDKGLNIIGGGGFRLFGLTTLDEKGSAGWHIFKRPAWNLPVARPRFEYKRIDSTGIEKLGEGKFDDGMRKAEHDHWELVFFTSDKAGQIGWFYFERAVAAAQ